MDAFIVTIIAMVVMALFWMAGYRQGRIKEREQRARFKSRYFNGEVN